MLEMGPLSPLAAHAPWRHIVLISSDKDYIPAIRILSKMGFYTVVIGFDSAKTPYPIELVNESYLFLDMGEILEQMETKIG